MFSKLLGNFFWVLFFLSCAKPNYQTPPANTNTNPTAAGAPCNLRLPAQNICFSLVWLTPPTDSQMGVFELQFASVPQGELSVMLWMPSHGHGSRPTVIENLGNGLFRVSKISFIMPGEWEIHFRLKENNQVIDEAIYKITD